MVARHGSMPGTTGAARFLPRDFRPRDNCLGNDFGGIPVARFVRGQAMTFEPARSVPSQAFFNVRVCLC